MIDMLKYFKNQINTLRYGPSIHWNVRMISVFSPHMIKKVQSREANGSFLALN